MPVRWMTGECAMLLTSVRVNCGARTPCLPQPRSRRALPDTRPMPVPNAAQPLSSRSQSSGKKNGTSSAHGPAASARATVEILPRAPARAYYRASTCLCKVLFGLPDDPDLPNPARYIQPHVRLRLVVQAVLVMVASLLQAADVDASQPAMRLRANARVFR